MNPPCGDKLRRACHLRRRVSQQTVQGLYHPDRLDHRGKASWFWSSYKVSLSCWTILCKQGGRSGISHLLLWHALKTESTEAIYPCYHLRCMSSAKQVFTHFPQISCFEVKGITLMPSWPRPCLLPEQQSQFGPSINQLYFEIHKNFRFFFSLIIYASM